MTDMETTIAAETTRRLQLSALREVDKRLHDAKVSIKNLRALAITAETWDDLAPIVKLIEDAAWRNEQHLQAREND